MENLKNSLNWAEIPVTDFERAKKFYSTIYDYEMPTQQMGSNLMGFLLMEQESQGVGAGIVKGDGYVPSQEGTLIYLNGGKDLNVVLNRVEAAGGKVLVPKTQITAEIGYFALFLDTEGNKLGIHSME
jgi:uncharacterized protein